MSIKVPPHAAKAMTKGDALFGHWGAHKLEIIPHWHSRCCQHAVAKVLLRLGYMPFGIYAEALVREIETPDDSQPAA